MDVLPLYILLLLLLPMLLWLLLRTSALALAASAGLYVSAREFGWNLAAYPAGEWSLNPFTWQLLFVLGAWCALEGDRAIKAFIHSRIVLGFAVGFLLFAFAASLMLHFLESSRFVPAVAAHAHSPLAKAELDLLRLAHFAALAIIAVRVVPVEWTRLEWRIFAPAILCGEHSLPVFCFSVFLAFAGETVFAQLSNNWPIHLIIWPIHLIIDACGIALMVGLAWFIAWFEPLARREQPFPMST